MNQSKKTKNVTIKDVADLAGVSLMTVSRAIRKPESVSKKTREQVELAISKLNYIPDLSAGSLGRRSNSIALILPSLSFEGHVRTVNALSVELREAGFHLLIGDNFYSPHEELELLRLLLGHRPAGIVIYDQQRLLRRRARDATQVWCTRRRIVAFAQAPPRRSCRFFTRQCWLCDDRTPDQTRL